jgi:hypothetical protein
VVERGLTVIPLVSSATVLHEVEVRDSLSGGEILRIALQKIPDNFPMKPFLMEGFYRDVKQVGGTYISLLEAAVEIYDDSYGEPRNKSKLRERVKLLEVRKSLGYDNKFTTYFGQRNLLEDLLLHNNIRYRQIDMHDQLFANTHREADSYYNGRSVFVVTNKTNFFLKVFIDKLDYAITHLQFQVSGPNDQRKKNLVSKQVSYEKTIDFKRYQEKMFLNYINVTSREKWYDPADTVMKFETALEQHLMINEVYTETDRRIGSTEKMRNYGLQYQDYPYNKPFWDNYNVLKETPIDRQILHDLERLAPLDKQFEDRF